MLAANIWEQLFGNLAFVTLGVALLGHFHIWYRPSLTGNTPVMWGFAAGLTSIGSIFLAVEFEPGVFIDLRYAPLALAGGIGGPLAGAIAAGFTVLFRLYLGGIGAAEGIVSVVSVTAASAFLHVAQRPLMTKASGLALVALTMALVMAILLFAQPLAAKLQLLHRVGAPLIFMNAAAILIGGLLLQKTARVQLERRILEAAYAQSPDHIYVKDRNSRYISSNINLARHFHLDDPANLIGTSDFSLRSRPEAEASYLSEQEVIKSGTEQLDRIEHQGRKIYLASRVPIRDDFGDIIGVAGVSRDITRQTMLEKELRYKSNLLSAAMQGMSDGFAMYNQTGYLVYCNDKYRDAFPLSKEARKIGAHIKDIIAASVAASERAQNPPSVDAEWIEAAAATLHQNKDEIIELASGTWLHLKTRLSNDGNAMVIVSDITSMKRTELALEQTAAQLRELADTDGLTGLANRRTFDQAMSTSSIGTPGTETPLSLLMIDVDHFKAYNDSYGHLSGDACLQKVAAILQAVCNGPSDLVARYGGEEFAVLLKNTDAQRAAAIAQEIHDTLAEARLPHSASKTGFVTVSIGIVTALTRTNQRHLIAAADEALYEAKRKGRNQSIVRSSSNISDLV